MHDVKSLTSLAGLGSEAGSENKQGQKMHPKLTKKPQVFKMCSELHNQFQSKSIMNLKLKFNHSFTVFDNIL